MQQHPIASSSCHWSHIAFEPPRCSPYFHVHTPLPRLQGYPLYILMPHHCRSQPRCRGDGFDVRSSHIRPAPSSSLRVVVATQLGLEKPCRCLHYGCMDFHWLAWIMVKREVVRKKEKRWGVAFVGFARVASRDNAGDGWLLRQMFKVQVPA